MDEKIISGIVGGSIVLIFRIIYELIRDRIKERKEKEKKAMEERESLTVGSKKLKIIRQDFLYQYEPGKLSIEKVLEELGAASVKMDDEYDGQKILIYKYDFANAKVLFSTYLNESDIVSITLFALPNGDPINCRLSFEEDDAVMGQAVISDVILKDQTDFETESNIHEAYSHIKARYFYRQIKHLTFVYRIENEYENAEASKGQIIQQVCVTQNADIYPMLHFFDTFYV